VTNNRNATKTGSGRGKARETTHPSEFHDSARLAYLVELILEDQELAELHPRIMQAAAHPACSLEKVAELGDFLESSAGEIGISEVLLAICLIQWANEADLAPNAIEGSDDWFALPDAFLDARLDLRSRLEALCMELKRTFRGAGLEPEEGMARALMQATELRDGTEKLLGEIRREKGRRKRLFYEQSKHALKAYYLVRIRKRQIEDRAFVQLFAEAGEPFDLSIAEDFVIVRKRVYDAVDSIQDLVDGVLRPYGIERIKRPYRKSGE
jgi:hypothetical protein